MSATKSTTKQARVVHLRKATFTTEVNKGERIFRPVNKRASKWARKQGKRTRLTLADMRAIKATKKVKLYVYTDKGLRAARV